MGVDLATFNRMARGLLSYVGMMPDGLAHVSKDQWETGNQMAVSPEDYLETLQWLEEDLQSTYDDHSIRIPVDKADANVMYTINPGEIKFDPRSLSQAAAIFHFAGENWTMPSAGWDMTNFGFFTGDDDLAAAMPSRVYDAAERLRAKKIVMTECGHGYRSLKWEGPNWAKRAVGTPMESIVGTMLDYVRSGRIRVDKTRNSVPITYHDSCNLARSCGVLEEPRELLRLVCTDFREMFPNRAENYCCTGGGGALMMPEYSARRLQSAKVKAEQLEDTGAKIVATSCHNCVQGLSDVISHYKLEMEVTQLVNLVSNAMLIPEVGSSTASGQS
jgi:Fe-S oxidoreductase